jgi:opacity protein-like surface antigen
MRKLAIAMALASTALATPAVARDHSVYVGLEGGVMWVEDLALQVTDGVTNPNYTTDHKTGYDIDAIAGYDFGPVRLEAELGYKHASIDSVNTIDHVFAAGGKASVLSLMGNLLFDFGDENGLSGYGGVGAGIADAKYGFDTPNLFPYGAVDFSDSDSKLAYQVILGMRYAVSPNIDLGLKYRFFTVSRLGLNGPFGQRTGEVEARFRSHSLLASVNYNLSPPPPRHRRRRRRLHHLRHRLRLSASSAASGAGTRSLSGRKGK